MILRVLEVQVLDLDFYIMKEIQIINFQPKILTYL